MIRTPLAAFVVAVSLALAACGDGDVTKGTGQGTIVAIDAAKNEITLDHGEIPGLMGAMTMTFAVSDPKLLEGLAQGRAVEFDLENQDGRYVVLAVRAK
jgi:Cu/Ag efflux protein CusF